MERIVSEHPNLASALGAWFALEAQAAILAPERMLPRPDAEGENAKPVKSFDGVAFEHHMDGLISDFIEFSTSLGEGDYRERASRPCRLIVVPHVNPDVQTKWPDTNYEWQWCLCGFCRIEGANHV